MLWGATKWQAQITVQSITRLCEPELLVAAEPAGAGQFISGMWVGLTWLNIAQLLLSAHCAAG